MVLQTTQSGTERSETVLITGGNGNLGRLVAERLQQGAARVVKFDIPGTEPAQTAKGSRGLEVTTIATFFHQLHHRFFTCNYGNVELPMDRWFGSFNDGSTAATKRLLLQGRKQGQSNE